MLRESFLDLLHVGPADIKPPSLLAIVIFRSREVSSITKGTPKVLQVPQLILHRIIAPILTPPLLFKARGKALQYTLVGKVLIDIQITVPLGAQQSLKEVQGVLVRPPPTPAIVRL